MLLAREIAKLQKFSRGMSQKHLIEKDVSPESTLQ